MLSINFFKGLKYFSQKRIMNLRQSFKMMEKYPSAAVEPIIGDLMIRLSTQ